MRRRRLDLRNRGDRLRLRVRGLRCGGARPGVRDGGLSSRNGNRDGNGAYALAGDDAEGFSVYGAASSEDLVEHTRQCDFLVTLSTQLEMEMDGVYLGKRC